MKKQVKKSLAFVIILCALCYGNVVSAHEVFCDSNGNGIVLKWINMQNGVPHLRINGDYLESPYTGYFSSIVQAWPNATTMVSAVEASFSSSTVDMLTASEDYWIELYDIAVSGVWGFTQFRDSTGYVFNKATQAQYSNGDIVDLHNKY